MSRSVVELSPVETAASILRQDHWETPERVLDALWRPGARVAVKACHASSKTFTAACAVCLTLLGGGDAITTAPTWAQVRDVLWKEIRRAVEGSEFPVREWGELNQTELRMADGPFALGLSTNEGVRFQGHHARPGSSLLVVLDEAPGVLPEIWDAIEGIGAGGDVRLLAIGNPIEASGPFYDIFAGEAPGWERFTINAFETPNLAGLSLPELLDLPDAELDRTVRPYLVTRRWVRDRYREWGPGHPLWQSRVLGEFPTLADISLVPLAWLEAAANKTAAFDPKAGPVVAGLDVAGPGEDETALCLRQGSRLLHLEGWMLPDTRGVVLAALRSWLHRGLSEIRVDSAGIGWERYLDLCDEFEPRGVAVRPVNVGESPTGDDAREQFANLKAELYWALRERFRDGDLAGLSDRRAFAQLASVRYKHDGRGRVLVEPKAEALKRGVKSPDRAEAIMLAFAPEDPRDVRDRAYVSAIGRTTKLGGRPANAAPGMR